MKNTDFRKFVLKYLQLSLLLATVFFLFMPKFANGWDINLWKEWAMYNYAHGLQNIYYTTTDYLPLMHYVFMAYGWMQDSKQSVLENIIYLKHITLIFHFVTGFFLALFLKKSNVSWDKVLFGLLFYILNIAVLYNAMIWGQVDDILTCLVFVSCFFAYRKNIDLALIFLVLALNFKLQALVFVPIVGLMLLPVMMNSFSVKKLIRWVLLPTVLQFLILIPFIVSNTLPNVWFVIKGSVGKYPTVSMEAYNIWEFVLKGNLRYVPDMGKILGVTYKYWGLLAFFGSSALALFPLAKQGFLAVKQKLNFTFPLEKVFIIFAIIPLLFFYFNTQMHERYAHPALVFLVAYALYERQPLLAITGCVAYFLNMEAVLRYLELPNYGTFIFHRKVVSLLYLFTIIGLFAELYGVRWWKLLRFNFSLKM